MIGTWIREGEYQAYVLNGHRLAVIWQTTDSFGDRADWNLNSIDSDFCALYFPSESEAKAAVVAHFAAKGDQAHVPIVPPKYIGRGLDEIQNRVMAWCKEVHANHPDWDSMRTRVHRFIEEAIELAQSCDVPSIDIDRLVAHIYKRPRGDRRKEIAGVMMGILALTAVDGSSLHELTCVELERIETPEMRARVSERQSSKDAVFETKPTFGELVRACEVSKLGLPQWDWENRHMPLIGKWGDTLSSTCVELDPLSCSALVWKSIGAAPDVIFDPAELRDRLDAIAYGS